MYIASIDQGTTSTRCMLFDHSGAVVSVAQKEHDQIFPQPGWVEHDPAQILRRVDSVVADALKAAGATAADIAGVGITNQRETVVLWNSETGKPVGNAIVWQDVRTAELARDLGGDEGADRFRKRCGLPLATYFSGPKIRWALDHWPEARRLADNGKLAVGTIDSWVAHHLTGLHITDVTNASRTMLMNIETLEWDRELCRAMGVPVEALPRIVSSSDVYGTCVGALEGVPLSGMLGDQQAALFGQACTEPGEAKNTYGTGCFMLLNTGTEIVHSGSGLLTTVGYRLGDQPAVYALEGSVAIAGALIQWLRDNLGLISSAEEVEGLAHTVPDNGGVYVVPAFSGLFAPHWRDDARGVIVGLTRFVNRAHIARASLEAVAFQVAEVLEAMKEDGATHLTTLKADGGMVVNELLMQFQADLIGLEVVRPKITETTALGAAYAAGLAVGFWGSVAEVRSQWAADKVWRPQMEQVRRSELLLNWDKAVERTLDWA
jgi:glycerol kinase